MTWSSSLRIVHNGYQTVGSTSAMSSFRNFQAISSRAYTDYITLSIGSEFSNFLRSNYVYLTGGLITPSSYENTAIYDVGNYSIIQHVIENLALFEGISTSPATMRDNPSVSDSINQVVVVSYEERLAITDSASTYAPINNAEGGSLFVDMLVSQMYSGNEKVALGDNVHHFGLINRIDCSRISVREPVLRTDTTRVVIKGIVDTHFTTQLTISAVTLAPVANATSLDNPFLPTVIVGGTIVYSQPETLPADYSGTNVLINMESAGVASFDVCDLYQFGFNLDYAGGSFNVVSGTKFADLEDTVTIFGLRGGVTKEGPIMSNSANGRTTTGIFGNIKLNKQLNFLLYGTPWTRLLNTQELAEADADTWLTAKSAALAVSAVAGINLRWEAPDIPLRDFSLEGSMTGITALSSLAGRVGATLRWSGVDTYTVTYPNRYWGLWEVPDCSLLAAAGIQGQDLLDLETGVQVAAGSINQAASVVPVLTADPSRGTTTIPGALAGSVPAVVDIAKNSKYLGTDHPPIVYDLPIDFDQVYIQTLVAPGQPTNGLFVTNNYYQWFSYNYSVDLAKPTIVWNNVGGIYKPQVILYPEVYNSYSNGAVNSSNFVTTISCTKKSLSDLYEDKQDDAYARQQELLARYMNSYRFIKVYEGTINSLFFGSIPLPGMWGKATVDGITVEGIIESVSFASPGILTVQVAQYVKANFTSPYSNIQNPFTTGGGPGP